MWCATWPTETSTRRCTGNGSQSTVRFGLSLLGKWMEMNEENSKQNISPLVIIQMLCHLAVSPVSASFCMLRVRRASLRDIRANQKPKCIRERISGLSFPQTEGCSAPGDWEENQKVKEKIMLVQMISQTRNQSKCILLPVYYVWIHIECLFFVKYPYDKENHNRVNNKKNSCDQILWEFYLFVLLKGNMKIVSISEGPVTL